MRGYKTLIHEAELMAMPPDAVAEFLKHRAKQSRDQARDDPVDMEAEQALLGRNEPLIALSLARHGRHMEVVAGLFGISEPSSPLRLACLANTSLGQEFFPSFPTGLLGQDAAMAEWLMAASEDELSALFENPTLSDSFLRDVLERGKGWEAIGDDRLRSIVAVLHRNPRMRTPREDDYMDGWAEYSYGAVFNAAWKLAETAPATQEWAAALSWLYEQLQPEAFSIKEPLGLAARWHVDPADEEAIKREADSIAHGWLDSMQRVRKGIARLALSKSSKLLPELAGHADVAFRCAAYSAGSLTADQLSKAYEVDGELAFNESIRNLSLWRRPDTRQALHDIAWAVVRADKHSDLMAANQYNGMEKDLRKKHPSWFPDDGEGQATEMDGDAQEPATKADIAGVAAKLDLQGKGIEAAVGALKTLLGRTGWIWWFALGALAATILRH